MGSIVTTAKTLNSGQSSVAGNGATWRFAVSGTWAAEDTFVVGLVNSLTGQTQQVGAGTVTGVYPTVAMTFKQKVNVLAEDSWYFSDFAGGPLVWNNINFVGNGFIGLKDYFGTAEDYVGIANFEGGLCLLARNTVQVWSTDPVRDNYNQRQTLKGIGTCAPRSVQAVGDSDVRFLGDSGPRSLRVRAATTNAYPFDFGSPVQKLVRAVLQGLTDAQKATACSVTDPDTNNYWLFIPATVATSARIWVFSDSPESGVAAWSTYRATSEQTLPPTSPTYNALTSQTTITGLVAGRRYQWTKGANDGTISSGDTALTASGTFIPETSTATLTGVPGAAYTGTLIGQVEFVPSLMVVHDSRVYLRAGDEVFLYGGTDNATYDRCGVQCDTPFMNGKTPATRKGYEGVDVACEGTWLVSVGCKPSAPETVKLVYNNTDSSFERGKSLAALQGTHFKMRFEETGSGYALLSSAILHFQGGDNK